jgi:hypothetical protein
MNKNIKTMNYTKIYNQLMERAKGRKPEKRGYYESHHIIPKCMGGSNDKMNKVKLTYREHFIAHWLLHRANPTNKSLAASFHIMVFGTGWRNARKERGNEWMPSSRQLEEAKMSKVMERRGTKHSEETRKKMSESVKQYIKENGHHNKGSKLSEGVKEKMRLAKLGKKRSDEVKKRISEGKKKQVPTGPANHRYGTKHTEETKAKLRAARARREELKPQADNGQFW